MTQLDVIRMIGDRLTDIDVAVGSLLPSDPDMVRLQDLRRALDARQLAISRQVFDDNTPAFKKAAGDLKTVNDQIRASLSDIDDLVTMIANLTRFVNSVTTFITAVGGLI